MNSWLIFILLIIIIGLLLECTVSLLNLKALKPELPDEFADVYDSAEYSKSQNYTKATTSLSIVSSLFSTTLTLIFLLLGGFNFIDIFARSFGYGSILTGIIFSGILIILSYLVGLPFSVYSTFVIEERFGFNKTTPLIFIQDTLKALLLVVILGGPLLSVILFFFEIAGTLAWIYCWVAVICFSTFVQFIAPVVILPLFNTFTPLEEGELKEQITEYAHQQNFQIKGIFTMDGSKRSTKLNAFFTGFGRFRKIVFYDTLVEKLSSGEIIAVLAHEMGHFKLKHIIKMLVVSTLQTGLMFFLLSLTINNEGLFEAFKMDSLSIYASLIFFSFIFSPVNLLVSVIFNFISRKHEYQADSYARVTTGDSSNLISGLKKLSQANLSNLTPHPFAVFMEYSHPPVIERIKALQASNESN